MASIIFTQILKELGLAQACRKGLHILWSSFIWSLAEDLQLPLEDILVGTAEVYHKPGATMGITSTISSHGRKSENGKY